MPDAHTPEQRSHNMSRIRSSGTAPERRLGELLRLMFPQEILIEQPTDLPGKPDWYVPHLRLVLFADGCFFHKCPKHFIMPENNKAYWEPKLARNKKRDGAVNAATKAAGLIPVRIWEHDLRKDVTNARRKIRRALRQSFKQSV
jgi:DNA mismatch endonuclease (patch repair protein)